MNNSKPKREITVPEEIVQKWQGIVNLIAKIINVPAALIMKVDPPYIEVFRSSESANNPYEVGSREHLAGLYCETVIKTREKLLIPNALKDKHWKKKSCIKSGMISYLGFPLFWPNDEIFGTICVLDSKENKYSKDYVDMILLFKENMEAHLILLYKNLKLEKLIAIHKETELELQESEEKYRLISENANDMIHVFNEKYEFEYINEQTFMKFMGYLKDELIGKSCLEFIHPADLKRASKELRGGFKKGKGSLELRLRHKNGTYRWIEVSGSVYRDKNEKKKALLIGRDVTERKLSEQRLKESEVKYRHLFETSPNFIGLLNRDGILIDCNDAINDLQSIHTIKDVISKNFIEIILLNEKNTYLIPIYENLIKNIFEGVNQEGFDFRLNRSIGGYLWLHVEATLIEIEEQKLIQFIIQDITKRKTIEEELLKEKLFTETALNTQQDTFFIFEISTGKALRWNKPFRDSSGYSDQEISKMKAPDSYYSEEDLKKAERTTDLILSEGVGNVEMSLITKSGKKIPFEYYSSIMKDSEGNPNYIISIGRDITERIKAEKEIAKLAKFPLENPNPVLRLTREKVIYANKEGEEIFNTHEGSEVPAVLQKTLIKALDATKTISTEISLNNRLFSLDITPISEEGYVNVYGRDITERKIAEDQLESTMEDLKRSNAELEQFTYVASHDLKEPLRMISSFAQLLEKQYKDKLDEGANDFIRFITEGVVRMQDLINNLLKYSKIGKLSREFEKVDLNNVLKDAIDNLKKIINETNAEVIYDSLPSLFVDKYQLLQVFQNLISNAIKFHGESPPLIHVSANLQKKQWIFSIRDNGIGIDPKDFERIFVIFKRLHARDEFGGTGIGLAICKKIVEQYGGKIWVESEVGKGSTFYFSIPKEIDKKAK